LLARVAIMPELLMKKEGGRYFAGRRFLFCDKWMEEKNESQETEGAGLLDFTRDRVISIRYNCTEIVVSLYCDKTRLHDYTDYSLFSNFRKKKRSLDRLQKFLLEKGVKRVIV
jgi:hypothetical protein